MVKKYYKQISVCLILFAIVLFIFGFNSSSSAFAKEPDFVNNSTTSASSSYVDYGYVIEKFDAVIDCSAGRKAKIVETIHVNFNENRHGIYRDLTMASGEDYFNIKVSGAESKLDKNSNYLRIIIGSGDEYVRGSHIYKISYTVTMPKYKESKDSLLYNVVPFGFDTAIESFNIKFIMPTSLDESKIQLVSGSYGSDTNNYAKASVEGKTLTISSINSLNEFQGVSVRMNFPEGTLNNVVNLEPLYIFLFGAVIFAAAVIMLFVYGREDQIVEVVRFDPPYNMPPCDLGYLIDGKVSNEDITSLFFYWASLGAMEIRQNKKKYTFVKKSELPDKCKAYEKQLFSAMFMFSDEVDPTQLNETFVAAVQKAKLQIRATYRRNFYTTASKKIANVFMMLSVGFVIISSMLADYFKYGLMDFGIAFLGIIIGAVIYGYFMLGKVIMESILKIHKNSKKSLYFLLYGLLGIIIAVCGMFALSVMQKFTLAKSFCMIICPILTCWIAPYIHKRSEEYNSILGEILGFRNFILIAEKDKLEALVKESPTYFYDVLPFANVLGVSDILSNKFKDIPMKLPFWYTSDVDLVDIYIINNMTRTITASVTQQIAQVAAEAAGTAASSVAKFGGGKSGGGFRGGGGFGGGGGGSW